MQTRLDVQDMQMLGRQVSPLMQIIFMWNVIHIAFSSWCDTKKKFPFNFVKSPQVYSLKLLDINLNSSVTAFDEAFFGAGHIELSPEINITEDDLAKVGNSKTDDEDIFYQLTADEGKQVGVIIVPCFSF